METVLFILNLPITLAGIFLSILSFPYKIKLIKNPFAFVLSVKNLWWTYPYLKNARAVTAGHIILLGPKVLKNDLEHELIHVKQGERYPLIFPLLYLYELLKRGYRQNRFEYEAYTLSMSVYKGENKAG